MSEINRDDGTQASVELQTLIMKMLEKGLDPASTGLAACSIGTTMLVEHFGEEIGKDVVERLLNEAIQGNLKLYPGLKSANSNRGPA